MFGGGEDAAPGRNDPGDLFAAASSSAARHGDDGGDLFGTKPAGSASSPSSQANSKLRGERNENSVLFSLNNLAQLASDKPASATSHAAPTQAAGAATGASGGEGSGLIDIRSMASAYLGGPGGGPAKPVSAGVGSIDDLPVFGGGGFSEPAVIVPISARASGGNKLVYALIGSVGVLAVAAVIVVVVLLKGGDKATQVAAVTATETKPATDPATADSHDTKPADTAARPAATAPAPTQTAPPSAATAPTPPVATAPTAPPSEPPPQHTAPPPVHKTPAATTSAPSVPAAPKPPRQVADKPAAAKPEPPPTKAPAADSGGCDEISCVLNNNEGPCCAKFAKKGKAGGGGGGVAAGGGKASDLPDSLDRAMISDGIGKVRARVMSCGDKSPAKGQVKVSVKVGPDGHVSSVTVRNTPDDGLGNCVAGMVQKAIFARTQSGGQFAYPYTF
jgi:outer membrane biosynthesis protein TonB